MRNLKKVLSLSLALVMLLGLMVVGAGAATNYTDASDITYKEAVDVMSAIGVFNGSDNGDFQPNGDLTREQAAKIITYMLMGQEAADKLTATTAPFKDVAANRWSAGSIAYCVQQGILTGDGKGNFYPTQTVNGYAFAKMLLVALGYDAGIQKYTGSSWAINVSKDAYTAGLDKGLNVSLANNLTREQACQMAFNTLKADMVYYTNRGTEITTDGMSVVVGASAPEKVAAASGKGYDGKDDKVTQFCERYFSTLTVKTAVSTDDFGRPAITWQYGTPAKEINTYAKAADLSYTKGVKGGDLYNDLGKPEIGTVEYYEDTKEGTTTLPTGFAVANKNDTTIGGNGTLIEVYTEANSTNDKLDVDIVVINTYFGKVTAVTEAKGSDPRTVTVAGLKYETAEFAKDDAVLYTKADNEIQSMSAPETASGKVSSINSSKKTFVADGTTYEWSAKSTSSVELKGEYDLYLDNYGYVIAAEVTKEAASQYAVVLDVKTGGWTGDVKEIKLALSDGTVVAVNAKAKTGTTIDSDLISNVVAYTVSNDVYTIEKVGTTLASSTIKTGNATIDGSTDYTANSKTVFLVKTGDKDNTTYVAYVGIAKVPGMTGATGKIVVKDGVAEFVYIDAATLTGVEAEKLVYINFTGADKVADETGTYYVCNAVVDGATTTVKVDEGANVNATGLYKALVYNKDNIVTSGTKAVAGTDYTATTGAVAESNGVITLGGTGYGYTSDAVAFKVNGKGEITSIGISGIETDGNDTVWFTTNKDGVVTAVYVIEVSGNNVIASVNVVDGTDGFTAVTTPKVDQKLNANVVLVDGTTVGVYPATGYTYKWYYAENGQVIGSEAVYTVTSDNVGKTIAVEVTGPAGVSATWTASGVVAAK